MERKRSRRDRKDGYYLAGLDSMHVMMPFLFGNRTANEAVLGEVLDMTAVDEWLQAKNSDSPEFKYTWFHVIAAALAKTIYLRPKMNYFISGHRYYERKKVIVAFNVKRQFADESEEAMAKFVLDPQGAGPVDQVHDYVQSFVHKVRVEDRTEGITGTLDIVKNLPRPLFRLMAWALRKLEYHGLYPESLAKDDPSYSSVYITNLGSIKMSADYHHLFDWGTNSFFVTIGIRKPRAIYDAQGNVTVHNTIKLGLTIDERIADGYYFAKSLKILRELIAHPELLELPVDTPVEVEG